MTLPDSLLPAALLAGGACHLVMAVAGSQLARVLDWKNELRKIDDFSRKIVWVHGFFIFLTVVFFGLVTLLLWRDLLAGGPVATALCLFIGVFWAVRIASDLWYGHAGWPEGRLWVLAHLGLDCVIVYMAGVYLLVGARGLLG